MKNWRMSWGYELEVGDVQRSLQIPEKFGAWEYAETDIVNLRGAYKNIATDPLGKEPPVGGEINIFPSRSPTELANRVCELIEWFKFQGDDPTASCVNHGHVHVRVDGLRDDIEALKRVVNWINDHQDHFIRHVYGYREDPLMAQTKTARTYLKWDGGRPMPDWMVANIVEHAKTFDDFIRIQCCGKDGVSMGRPLRYAINTYCMKHTDTIEFRFFRASLAYNEIFGSIVLARDILRAALGQTSDLGQLGSYKYPPFFYDHESYLGWERSKWSKERGKKERYFREI